MLLVLKQPDLGTSLTYIPVLIIGMFLGGINLEAGADSDTARAWCWWSEPGAAARC